MMCLLRKMYRKVRDIGFDLTTYISPRLNTKLRYRYLFKKRLDLKNPKTFLEKLSWLKLYNYNHNPLVVQCADKYCVREYVKARGYEDHLNVLLGVWDRAEDIPWDELPEKFVLKWNFGAGR